MKRIFCLILVLVLTTVPVLGAEFETIFDLWNHWSAEGVPDWVSGVSSTDGSAENLTVIVNSTEAEEQLRAMLKDVSTLTVIVSVDAYSEAEMQKVQEEIVREFMSGANPPVASIGIGWAVIDGELTGFGESGKESRVVAGVLEEFAEEYRQLFRERYGDMVYVEAVEGYAVLESGAEAAAEEKECGPGFLYAGIAVGVLLAASVGLVLAKKKLRP